MSLTLGDVHLLGPVRTKRRRRLTLLYKAWGGRTLSAAEIEQRRKAALISAQRRRGLTRGGAVGLTLGAAGTSLLASSPKERLRGVSDWQERFARSAGYLGAGVGGLAGGLAGGGIASLGLGLAGSVAGQELFERGALALTGRDMSDSWSRFKHGNKLESDTSMLGGALGGTAGWALSALMNRSSPGRFANLGREILLGTTGGVLGSELGRAYEGRKLHLAETGGSLGLSLLSLKGRRGYKAPEHKAWKPYLSNDNIKRRFRLQKSDLSQAEIEQRRQAARARWANHTPAPDDQPRSVWARVRDNAGVLAAGAAGIGLGLVALGLTRGRSRTRGGKAARLLMDRAIRSQGKASRARFESLSIRIGHLETKAKTGKKLSTSEQAKLKRLMTERAWHERRMGGARTRLKQSFDDKLTAAGRKRTATNAKFRKFDRPLSEEEIEQRRAAGRASAAARRARSGATEVVTPSAEVKEVISPSFFTPTNVAVGALGVIGSGLLFALSRGRLKAREAKRTADLAAQSVRAVRAQTLGEMAAGVRGADSLAATAGQMRLIARGLSQGGDDLAAASQRAQRAVELLNQTRARQGNNLVNLPEGMRAPPRTPGSPNLLAGETTGTPAGDADLANRLRQVASWTRSAIGQERGARLSARPGTALQAGGGREGLLSSKINAIADAADTQGNRLASSLGAGRLTLRPIHSKRAESMGGPNLSLRRLNNEPWLTPDQHRTKMVQLSRDRLATSAMQDVTDAEAEMLLRRRAQELKPWREALKLKQMRGTSAFSEWGQVKGSGFVFRPRPPSFSSTPRLGGLRGAMEEGSTLFITPSSPRDYRFGGALSDRTSPFRRGRYDRS